MIQNHLGYSAITYGHSALLLGVEWLLGALCNQWLINRFSIYKIIYAGSSLIILISLISLIVSLIGFINLGLIVIPSAIVIFFISITYPNYMVLCMRAFPKMAGLANAIMGFLILSFSAIISAIMTLLPTTSFIPLVSMYLLLSISSLIILKKLTQHGFNE